jgi:hypothetical protein
MENTTASHRQMTGGFARLEEVFIKALPFFRAAEQYIGNWASVSTQCTQQV